MLGFDALGRLALGQLPRSSVIALPAAAGSFSVSGQAASFNLSEVAAASGSYALIGVSTSFKASFANIAANSYALTSVAQPLIKALGAHSHKTD